MGTAATISSGSARMRSPSNSSDSGLTGLAADQAGNLYTGGIVQGLGCCHGLGSAEGIVVYSAPLAAGTKPTSIGGLLGAIAQVPGQGAYALILSDSVFFSSTARRFARTPHVLEYECEQSIE